MIKALRLSFVFIIWLPLLFAVLLRDAINVFLGLPWVQAWIAFGTRILRSNGVE